MSSEWCALRCGVLGTGLSRSPRRSGIRLALKLTAGCHRVRPGPAPLAASLREKRESRARREGPYSLWSLPGGGGGRPGGAGRYGLFPPHMFLRGLAQLIPITRFCAEEHRARVDGRATARHLHGKIERAARCLTVKVTAESAGAVASTMFFQSLTTRQSCRLAQPDGGAGTPAGRGCHLQGR